MSKEVMYRCWVCGRTFSNREIELIERISCPYCSSKVIVKIRSSSWKVIKSA